MDKKRNDSGTQRREKLSEKQKEEYRKVGETLKKYIPEEEHEFADRFAETVIEKIEDGYKWITVIDGKSYLVKCEHKEKDRLFITDIYGNPIAEGLPLVRNKD